MQTKNLEQVSKKFKGKTPKKKKMLDLLQEIKTVIINKASLMKYVGK